MVTYVRSLDVQRLMLAVKSDLVHPDFFVHFLGSFLALLNALVLSIKVVHLLLDELIVDLSVCLALERLD